MYCESWRRERGERVSVHLVRLVEDVVAGLSDEERFGRRLTVLTPSLPTSDARSSKQNGATTRPAGPRGWSEWRDAHGRRLNGEAMHTESLTSGQSRLWTISAPRACCHPGEPAR